MPGTAAAILQTRGKTARAQGHLMRMPTRWKRSSWHHRAIELTLSEGFVLWETTTYLQVDDVLSPSSCSSQEIASDRASWKVEGQRGPILH